ncbi:MAG: M42 family peptidase [Leptolyngbya sp. SIO1E4]|nr:M42 family peptidase [Leptolyngbya sp. SIO1E4]
MCHSPSGAEQEINAYLSDLLTNLGVNYWQDEADNIIACIPGKQDAGAIAITAHKDEIGGIVKSLEPDGRISVRRLGGSFPWVYGEGVVDFLGDHHTISGILSFGSRHVSHESAQKDQQVGNAVTWETAWVETKLSLEALTDAGIRPGTRMVVGKHRKRPCRLSNHIASYTLDNKASIAILLTLAERLHSPPKTIYLVFSAKEEVGAVGALYFSHRHQLEALIALEICPLSEEYPISDGVAPVLLSQDKYGLYDEDLNRQLAWAASEKQVPLQRAVLSSFGSDGSIAMTFGHVPRAACLSFPTQNTHGYEIAHLGAIAHCIDILEQYCNDL